MYDVRTERGGQNIPQICWQNSIDLLVESLKDVVGLRADLKLVHVGRGDAAEGVPHHEELEAGGADGSMEFIRGLGPEPLSSRVKICRSYLKGRVSD